MTKRITDISPRKAAKVVGIAFIISFILAVYVGNFILPNFINPGDKEELANDIEDNERLLNMAIVVYLIILALDAAIALGLIIVLKPANRTLASLSGILRLLYVASMVISVLALAFQFIDVDSYGTTKLIGYLFFTVHILVTGYTVFISGYIPRIFGVLLILAFFSYVLAFYVSFLVPEALLYIFMVFMIIGELSLSLWFVLKNAKIPEVINQDEIFAKKTDKKAEVMLP
jgi:MFS family permease